MTDDQKKKHEEARVCYLHTKKIIKFSKKLKKVKDHCHYTGNYQVAAH